MKLNTCQCYFVCVAKRKEPRFFFILLRASFRAAPQLTECLKEAIYEIDHSICPNIKLESSRYRLNIHHTGNKPHSD